MQYVGTYNDGTGLYSMGNRYYSPSQSRFISQDPIGFGGGTADLYQYVGDDPINRVDPLGTGPASTAATKGPYGDGPTTGPGSYNDPIVVPYPGQLFGDPLPIGPPNILRPPLVQCRNKKFYISEKSRKYGIW